MPTTTTTLNRSLWEWYFRTSLDHWSTLLGMVFALNFPLATRWLQKVEELPAGKQVAVKGITGLGMGGAFLWWAASIFPQTKLDYNLTNSYFGFIPLLAYIYFRNLTPALRMWHSGLLHDIGKGAPRGDVCVCVGGGARLALGMHQKTNHAVQPPLKSEPTHSDAGDVPDAAPRVADLQRQDAPRPPPRLPQVQPRDHHRALRLALPPDLLHHHVPPRHGPPRRPPQVPHRHARHARHPRGPLRPRRPPRRSRPRLRCRRAPGFPRQRGPPRARAQAPQPQPLGPGPLPWPRRAFGFRRAHRVARPVLPGLARLARSHRRHPRRRRLPPLPAPPPPGHRPQALRRRTAAQQPGGRARGPRSCSLHWRRGAGRLPCADRRREVGLSPVV